MDFEDIVFGGIVGLILSIFVGPFIRFKKKLAPDEKTIVDVATDNLEGHLDKLNQKQAAATV